MKNKKNLYILLPAVLIVWSLVIYRFFKGLNPNTATSNAIEQVAYFKPKKIQESKPFIVNLDYRDPFLGTVQQKKKRITRHKLPTKKTEATEIPFPSIVYKGIVSPKGKNEKVFLISVNGQQHLFKLKTGFNDVKLLRGNTKEVTLQFKGKKQTFQLEK